MATIARAVVSLEAQTANFERGFQNATRTVGNFGKAVEGSNRGMAMVERGLFNLSAQAVGIQGPIGKVAEGLALFGGGTPLVLGVTAGLGLIASAMVLMGREAKEAEDRLDALSKTARGGVFGGVTAQAPLERMLSEAQGQLAAGGRDLLGGKGRIPIWHTFTAKEREDLESRVLKIQANLDAINLVILAEGEKIVATLRTGPTPSQLIATLSARHLAGFAPGMVGSDPAAASRAFLSAVGTRGNQLQIPADVLARATASRAALPAMRNRGPSPNLSTEDAIIGILGALQGGIGGGGIGALLGGGLTLGGTALFGPIGGAIGGLLSSVFGGLFGGKKTLPVEVKNFDELKKDTRPIIISNNFVGGTPDQVRDVQLAIQRAIRLGSIPRTSTRAA